MKDLLAGEGTADGRSTLPRGLQVPIDRPEPQPVLEEEVDGIAMAAKMSDAHGLEPRTINEAKRSPNWPQWQEAIEAERFALESHGTWRLEEPPSGTNVVGCRWVFVVKRDASGAINRYRARLVAQGFSQIPGVDFFDTYAPVAKLASARTVLAFAARYDFEIHQVDVKSAYLNGEFEENEVIYMRLPPGLNLTSNPRLALRLLKPLYGLRQSARHWYRKFWKILRELLRMKQCDVDQAVFFRVEGKDLIIIVTHVDDLTIVTSTVTLMNEVKTQLQKELKITDLGELHWILGIAVKRDRAARTISLSQKAYINSIIQRYGFENLKPLAMPMDPSAKLSSSQSPQTAEEFALMRDKPYRECVGSLMYASHGTRPDITYAVGILSKYLEKPGLAHWNALKRVFAYLAGSRDYELQYGDTSMDLTGYSDADGSMHEDRKAISGYAFLIDGGAVSWSSKKQEIIALSTTEAEYVATTHASKEALWLRSLIGQLFGHLCEPTTLYGDNQSAIALTKDHQYHARTKHIDIRFHFIRWVISEGKLNLVYCPTEDMIADTLTKALPSAKVKHFAASLGLRKD